MRHLVLLLMVISCAATSREFDHRHQALTNVLQASVVVYDNQLKSAVNYGSLAANPNPLNRYLDSLSSVSPQQYQQWHDGQQLAFLINAYNAFTLKLIVDNYTQFTSGEAQSIRDLGGLFTSPWELTFFTLLGQKRTLDWLEHEKIRVDFDEPRIHAALVCAAISCPKLRAEAYTAGQLENQLESQMVSFLRDHDKNGIDAQGVYLSKIFDWYGEDFNPLRDFLRDYGSALADDRHERSVLAGKFDIRYVDYNWRLNSIENR